MSFPFRNGVGLGTHTCFDGYETETEMTDRNENGEMQDCGDSNFNPVAVTQARAAPALLHARGNVSQALLMESLIKLLCQKYESDKHRGKLLFNVICDILHKTQLLDRTLLFGELKATRRRYSLTFDKLIQNVRDALPSENLKKDLLLGAFVQDFLSSEDVASIASEGHVYIHNSHYLAEFEEECCIGKGGFGIVCKAKKKVDQHNYAVKKIPFDHSDDPLFSKIIREVELFAKLSHPNIVSYKTAWIENSGAEIVLNLIGSSEESATPEETDGPRWKGSYYSMETSCDERTLDEVELAQFRVYNEERMEVVESTGITRNFEQQINISTKSATLLRRSQSVNHKVFEEEDSDDCIRFIPTSPRMRKKSVSDPSGDACKAMCTVENQRCHMKNIKSVLFVQMELCQENLRVWLDERLLKVKAGQDPFDVVDIAKVMEIFKQVMEGVAYLHNNKLVHRDLKPQNIMFDQNRIAKIGDFGLATVCCRKCDVEHRRPWVAAMGHTKGVGTSPYAAPEQRERSNYDSKADMYSLGVILFELLVPFPTAMERAKVLKDLEDGITSDEINQKYPQQVQSVLQLVNKTASLRPSADDVLNSAIFLSKDQLLSQNTREIAALKKRISELENLLRRNSIQF